MLLDEYQLHQRRTISFYSRRCKTMNELQSRLRQRGIKMKYTAGRHERIIFATQRNFRIDSRLGNDRVFTNMMRKNVDRNASLSNVKVIDRRPKQINPYEKFERMKQKRLERSTNNRNRGIGR